MAYLRRRSYRLYISVGRLRCYLLRTAGIRLALEEEGEEVAWRHTAKRMTPPLPLFCTIIVSAAAQGENNENLVVISKREGAAEVSHLHHARACAGAFFATAPRSAAA